MNDVCRKLNLITYSNCRVFTCFMQIIKMGTVYVTIEGRDQTADNIF